MTSETLSSTGLVKLIESLEGSDSVELKLTVDDDNVQMTSHTLGFDPIEAEIRQIVFFDTPDLALSRAGIVVRARRIQGGSGDVVVKLRPVVPGQLPDEIRASKHVNVETDVMPNGFVCSASMKRATTATTIQDVLLGDLHIKGLLSKGQRRLLKSNAPDGFRLKDLVALGPIFTLKLKSTPAGFAHKLVAEVWFYPDGSRILELSTKCSPQHAFDVAKSWLDELKSHGVDTTAEQHTKTKTAIAYFSSRLSKASP